MLNTTMNFSVMVFALMAILVSYILIATTIRELELSWSLPTQTGDSSLSPQSVNMLGVTALAGALLICLR